ncbi:hypothetical protein AAHA92_07192 [Salvia divinorum]|uniref:Myb/SANT-like domain-containing protein n=1 Tax=Salvia divinorum TaxID=28513 RepID=A0ABD1IB35_SALDI
MAHNLPPQSSFLYASNWTPELDSLLLGTMIRLKIDNNWDGTVFPSNFILEAESVIKQKLGYAFDWAALYDRLHFLEKRYKTFKEMLQVNGTYWDARTNLVIPGEGVWMEILPRNPLAGAYLSHGDPTYHMLADLFAHNDVKVEREKTVIMISDSSESCNNDFVVRKQTHYGQGHDYDGAIESEPGDHVRRKLVFEEGYPPDMLSTNNRGPTYYTVGEDGKMSKKVENEHANGSGSRQMKPRIPPKVPTYTCDSSSPIMWWRMPRKPM